ncbi:hypothetical protein EVAR_33935_1 [Eumeta japonica]|uniref:Uncharacterized protein n=1 Tax=Eumeta variegata TaxID=151549 RepID=A0A4C1VZZ5_EUMVA|nr:hypothetical protein EVAR_33935_1 [Eumeta japonica]
MPAPRDARRPAGCFPTFRFLPPVDSGRQLEVVALTPKPLRGSLDTRGCPRGVRLLSVSPSNLIAIGTFLPPVFHVWYYPSLLSADPSAPGPRGANNAPSPRPGGGGAMTYGAQRRRR